METFLASQGIGDGSLIVSKVLDFCQHYIYFVRFVCALSSPQWFGSRGIFCFGIFDWSLSGILLILISVMNLSSQLSSIVYSLSFSI